jgi:hypothetical protein
MAQLRAKQIKLNAVNDILVGGANGNGTVLSMGTDKTVLKVVGTTLQYAQQIAEDVLFSDASLAGVTDVKGAVLKVATDAAAAVAAEATRATGIEAGLRTDVNAAAAAVVAEATRATGEEARIEALVTAEVARATAAEGVVATAVTDEETRAKAAEAALQTAIDGIESAASDAVAAEKTRAEAAELKLTNDLAAEVTRATAAEGVLTTDLAKEVSDRTAADAAEVVARDAAIKVADDRAKAAELVLTTAIADEKTRAEAAELVLTTAVSDEATRATAAETALGLRIDDLVGLNALHFVGEVAGDLDAAGLAALNAKQGDVYRVKTAGAADFAGTGLDVNVGDFVAKAGTNVWVKFDNTDPAVAGSGNIAVSGNAHAGYTVSLTGIVGVANGGTGLAASGAEHAVLTSKADGSLEYAMVSGLRTAAGALVVDAASGKLVAVTSTVDADVAGTLTTKDYVDAKVAAATAAATAAAAVVLFTEDFAQTADAANASVTVAHTPKGDVSVFFNGVKLGKTAYTVVGKVVTLIDSVVGYSVENGDSINVSYMGAAA